jgi:predicted MPP superfamily phosphohydrolase
MPKALPIRILHLSDFHFSQARAWDSDPVLTGLAKDVKGLVAAGLKPDLVAVTGDVADRGVQSEYELAARWLREKLLPAAEVAPRDLLLVPGNHDVDRSKVKSVARATQLDLLKGDAEAQDRIAAVLSDPGEREPLLKRHTDWVEFARGFGSCGSDVLCWKQTREIGGCKLHIAGFCSSWMSCSDDDKGHLLLGRWQVNELVKGAEEADLGIALMHHPWDYLADFDVAEVREAIRRRFHLLLRGHWHIHGGERRVRPDGSVLELAAGCCYGDSKYPNAYHLIEIDPDAGRAHVHLRTWDGHNWIPDRNAYAGATPNGMAEFDLMTQAGTASQERGGDGESATASGHAINTGGGAAVLGTVDTGGGKFVGRDHIEIHMPASTGRPEVLLESYYRAVAEECSKLPLGIIDQAFVRTGGEQGVPLPDIYVDAAGGRGAAYPRRCVQGQSADALGWTKGRYRSAAGGDRGRVTAALSAAAPNQGGRTNPARWPRRSARSQAPPRNPARLD